MAKIINTGNFRGTVEDNQGVVVVDFLQHGVDLAKC